LICSPQPLRGIELLDRVGVLGVLLPELEQLKGVEQNPYHHLDVWGHTLEVLRQLVEMERDGYALLDPQADAVREQLERPLAEELTRGHALRLAALFHDIGKPATRALTPDGRVLFWGHDELGAGMTEEIGRRLRVSTALTQFLALIARRHLRLGFLVHERPLSRRQVYRYLRACEPVELEVTVLSLADRLATRGERTKPDALEKHLELARELAAEAIAWRSEPPPQAPLRGDDLMAELGLPAGPDVGRLLERLREAAFTGEVRSRDEALELARAEAGEQARGGPDG
jgi:putative nucleotidyltransferase with HDIG domain